ncbi:MAG: cation diffusion facilitator family transporter [Actinobacteria bacterium]|nr:cation diffusion facilitator family transporter [Actinomycetota bacterium]
MSPQRRSALISVAAAAALVILKLSVGVTSHSLGLVSEAAHSGTDLVAALLTYFALRVAARPADGAHQFGHGKAEHLSALAEAAFLSLASVFISVRAIERLTGVTHGTVRTPWYLFVVIGVVLAIDLSRSVISWRTARRYESAALSSNALHFASDFAGTLAVLAGLLFARAGHPAGDPIAALFVGVLVLLAAARLSKVNIDVLMDRAPADAEAAARLAISRQLPGIELRRLRMRQAGGRQFADVVIGVSADSAVGQGHAAADAVEAAVGEALPNADVVVHVEPIAEALENLRERAHAAAINVRRVREVHNISLVEVDGRTEISLHVKLPGDLPLDEAHDIAEELEQAICTAVPEIAGVQTHLEPLAELSSAREVEEGGAAVVARVVREATGTEPRRLRFLRTDAGLVAFLTLGLDGTSRLQDAHARASEIEEQIRREWPDIADVIVHTEP